MARKLPQVTVDVPPDCDVCLTEFPSSKAHPAKYDGIFYGGMHGNACKSHASNLSHKTCEYVTS